MGGLGEGGREFGLRVLPRAGYRAHRETWRTHYACVAIFSLSVQRSRLVAQAMPTVINFVASSLKKKKELSEIEQGEKLLEKNNPM